MEIKEEVARLEKNASQYGFTSSEVVPAETAKVLTLSSFRPKKRVNVLSRTRLSLFGAAEKGYS